MKRRTRLGPVLRALALAALTAFSRRAWLPITRLEPLFQALPQGFEISLVDVGSIGGLHSRWRPLRDHLATVGFDPLDKRRSSGRNRIFPLLLGGQEGEARLNITRRGSMSSTLRPSEDFFSRFWEKKEHVEIVETIAAPMTSLDSLATSEGIAPDALKIDVQGGEGAVLAGASRLLSESVILAEIECSFAERYEGQPTFDRVVALMRGHGFALLDLRRLKRYRYRNGFGVRDPSLGRGMRSGRLAFCDAIFLLEPGLLWKRIASDPRGGAELGLKATVLLLIYGKADVAAATFEQVRSALPEATVAAFDRFFRSLAGDGGWKQQLHHVFDGWAQRA